LGEVVVGGGGWMRAQCGCDLQLCSAISFVFFLARIGRHRTDRIDRVDISRLLEIFPASAISIIHNVLPFPSFYVGFVKILSVL
jgi:hypothetical protein